MHVYTCKMPTQQARDTATNSEIGEKTGKEREVARYEICERESEKYHGQIRTCLQCAYVAFFVLWLWFLLWSPTTTN